MARNRSFLKAISLRKGVVEFLMYRMSTLLPAAIRIFNQSDTCLARAKHMVNMQSAYILHRVNIAVNVNKGYVM